MQNVQYKNNCHAGTVQVHVEPPSIPLIKINKDDKSDKYFVEIKLRRDPTPEKLDLYKFKIALFDNGDTQEFLLFVCKCNMAIKALGMLNAGAKIQYICNMVSGEALRQFDALSAEVKSTSP